MSCSWTDRLLPLLVHRLPCSWRVLRGREESAHFLRAPLMVIILLRHKRARFLLKMWTANLEELPDSRAGATSGKIIFKSNLLSTNMNRFLKVTASFEVLFSKVSFWLTCMSVFSGPLAAPDELSSSAFYTWTITEPLHSAFLSLPLDHFTRGF